MCEDAVPALSSPKFRLQISLLPPCEPSCSLIRRITSQLTQRILQPSTNCIRKPLLQIFHIFLLGVGDFGEGIFGQVYNDRISALQRRGVGHQ